MDRSPQSPLATTVTATASLEDFELLFANTIYLIPRVLFRDGSLKRRGGKGGGSSSGDGSSGGHAVAAAHPCPSSGST